MSNGPFAQICRKTTAVRRLYEIQLGKMLQNERAGLSDQLVHYFKAKHVLWEGVGSSDLPQMWASPNDLITYEVKPGDLLVSEGGDAGRSAILTEWPIPCIVQNALHRVRSKRSDVRFLLYVLRMIHCSGWLEVVCNRATISHLTSEKLGALQIPAIPLPTQKAIADFLDRKTAAIDALIEKKQKLLDLLAEKRAALINQAVTKGLDPNVPMKDSGIPWIGEIPAHWEVKRLKNVCGFITSGPRGWGQYYSDDGPLFLRVTNVARDSVDLLLDDEKRQSVSPPSSAEGVRTLVSAGDVLVTITADLGSVGVVPDKLGEAYISQHVALCRPTGMVIPRLIAFILQSVWGRVHYLLSMNGGTKVGLGLEDVGNSPVVMMDRGEQEKITSYMDEACASFIRAAHFLSEQIERLQEYRQALITAAVTGQLDISEENKS